MEEILVAILQFFFEVVLQTLLEAPWDFWIGRRELRGDPSSKTVSWILTSIILGAGAGVISLWLFPNTRIHSSLFRLLYLIFAAPISGMFSYWFSMVLARAGREWIQPPLHAWCAFSFTLMVTLIRFAYVHRPS